MSGSSGYCPVSGSRSVKSRIKSVVKDFDRGFTNLGKVLAAARDMRVKVGIIGGEKDERTDGELTNTEIGIVHEFGAPEAGIPERPFIRPTLEVHGHEYRKMIRDGLASKVLKGQMTAERLFNIVGMKAAADIKARIREGIDPPNADSTVERKGSSTPLVDTGQLINSISWEVTKKGEDK